MTIFQLECFYALSQSLNFTQTANQQFITQPALSRSISSLEEELGVKLINRTTHKVSLTPAGKVFSDECKKIISSYQTGVQNAQQATRELIGRLRFGLPSDSFEPTAAELAQSLTKKHLGIQLELRFNTPTRLVRMLDDGLLDMIIASGRPRHSGSRCLLVDQRRDCIVVSNTHPLAGREEVSFSELRNERFIAISRASSVAGYESIISHAAEAGFAPNIVAEADTISGLLMQVACGEGITVLYKEHLPFNGEKYLTFIPLQSGRLFKRYLIWNQEGNPCLDAAIQVAKELYQSDEVQSI